MIGSIKKTSVINGDQSKTYRVTVTSSFCLKDDNAHVILSSMLKSLAENPSIYLLYGKGFFDTMKLSHDGEKWVAVFTTTAYDNL